MDDFDKFYNLSLRFLSFRPRSEKEIRDYLLTKIKKQKSKNKVKESNEDLILKTVDIVISRLKENNFLNDEEFTKWWTEQRTLYRPRATRVIKMELKQKGISDDLIQNSELTIKNDVEKAKTLAEKRIQRYKNLDKQKTYEKMVRFLASKGFSYDTIKEVIDQVLGKEYN